MKNKKPINISFGRLSLKDKIIFAKQLSAMLSAGLTIIEALDILRDQARGKFKIILMAIQETVMAGNSLSSALKNFPKHFEAVFIATIASGEAAGKLTENLEYLGLQLERQKEVRDKIRSAMYYPGIILGLSVILGIGLTFLVLPRITPIFAGLKVDLPPTTRLLIWIGEAVESYGGWLLASIIGIAGALWWLFKQHFMRPLLHALYLHVPIISKITKNKNLALFNRTLATLLKSGLNIDKALEMTASALSNYYYQREVSDIARKIVMGKKISTLLKTKPKYFPRLTVSLIKVGEASGRLEEELSSLAQMYETEVDQTAKKLTVAVEPILLVGIGLVVGVLALSIITPIYTITGNI